MAPGQQQKGLLIQGPDGLAAAVSRRLRPQRPWRGSQALLPDRLRRRQPAGQRRVFGPIAGQGFVGGLGAQLKMEMGRTARLANVAHLLPPRHAASGRQRHAVRVQVSIKGEQAATIRQRVLHNHHPLIPPPTQRLGIGHQPVPNAVHRRAQAGRAFRPAPILARVVFVKAVAPDAKILPARRDAAGVGGINGEVEHIHHPARGAAAWGRGVELGGAGVAREQCRQCRRRRCSCWRGCPCGRRRQRSRRR